MTQKRLVWLASYPKSGNTWLRAFLSNLLLYKNKPISINEFFSTPIASSRSLFDDLIGVSSSNLTQDEIDELRPQAYYNLASSSNEIIYLKVHDAWRKTKLRKALFPKEITKAVIYLIRNPLDVAVSMSFHTATEPNQMIKVLNDPGYVFCASKERLYLQLKQELYDWSGHVNSWISNSELPVVTIRYEDMLTDPFGTFSKVTEFIGIKKSKSEIAQAIDASSFQSLSEMEKREGFKEKPIKMDTFFRNGRAESWKDYLSETSVRELIKHHKPTMEKYGYL